MDEDEQTTGAALIGAMKGKIVIKGNIFSTGAFEDWENNNQEVSMSATQLSPEMEALKGRMKATWEAGDFGVIARSIEHSGTEFVARLGIGPGMKVLDVACGT